VILAIDPGPEQSAYVEYGVRRRKVVSFAKCSNEDLLSNLRSNCAIDTVVIEMIASYGMPVGREVFETCVWIGRFTEASRWHVDRISRGAIKLHLCGSMRAKDANVRASLIDAFGGKEKAIGNKKSPGPLYGVSGDVWSALAVAVTYADRTEQARAA
jgi:hypothetical protein